MEETAESEVIEAVEVEPPPLTRFQGRRPKGGRERKAADTTREIEKMLKLKAHGATSREIARNLAIPHRTVRDRLARFEKVFTQLKNVESYRDVRGKILDSAQLVVLESMMEPTKLKKASLNNCAYAFDKLYAASRLESGKSTSNTATVNHTRIDIEILEE
jgi:hypothetical protein